MRSMAGDDQLGKAINGPGMFYTVEDIPAEFRIPDPTGVAYGPTQFVANIPGRGAEVDAGTLHARNVMTSTVDGKSTPTTLPATAA